MTPDVDSPRARKKREQIREAARQLFLSNGFSATSMDMIRDLSGVSKQTLYVYYSSKEELLTDVIQQLMSVLHENEFSGLIERLPLSDMQGVGKSLELVAKRLLGQLMQAEYLGLARVIIAEVVRFPHLGKIFVDAVPNQALRNIAELLRKADQLGAIHVEDSSLAARAFVGPLITYVLIDGLLVGDAPSRIPGDEEVEALVTLYLKSIRKGVDPS